VFARKKPGKLGKIIGHSSLGKLGEQHTTIMQNVNREIVSSAPGKLVAQFKNCPFTRAATRFINSCQTIIYCILPTLFLIDFQSFMHRRFQPGARAGSITSP